jgi:hypothetical protein
MLKICTKAHTKHSTEISQGMNVKQSVLYEIRRGLPQLLFLCSNKYWKLTLSHLESQSVLIVWTWCIVHKGPGFSDHRSYD